MRVKIRKTVLTTAICLVLGGERYTGSQHLILPRRYTGCV